MCVCVSAKNTAVCCLIENRHEIALYRSASQFIFFERCLESRTSLLSSARVSNSCTAPRGIYGNWVCRPTTSLSELQRQIDSPSKTQDLRLRNREPLQDQYSQSQQPAEFYRMTVLHAEPFNRLSYSYGFTTASY